MREKYQIRLKDNYTRQLFRKEQSRLREVLRYTSADVHEPDCVAHFKVVLRGNHLDNAMSAVDVESSHKEYMLGVKRDGVVEWFNLANLLAIAKNANV